MQNILVIVFFSVQCSPCDRGKYCTIPGLTAPEGNCTGGYLCFFGANNSMPTDGVTGFICPAGQYCPSGIENRKYFCALTVYFYGFIVPDKYISNAKKKKKKCVLWMLIRSASLRHF